MDPKFVEKNFPRQPSHDLGRFLGMNPFHNLTVSEQVAAHLQREILEGRVPELMPGVLRLEKEMGVNRKTVEAALRLLETEGLLIPQGSGKRRKIAETAERRNAKPLRLAILLYERGDQNLDLVLDLQHMLTDAGHMVFPSPKSLTELGMDVARVARMVEQTEADAWLVAGGTSDVLEWFASRSIPVMALFGRRRQFQIASVGPDKLPAIRAATETLIGLGHRRIVYLTRSANRFPRPSAAVQAFLDELTAAGISPSPYHIPEWKDTTEGLFACLESLFKVTPPTAMILGEIPFLVAAQQFLASKKLRVPLEISLVCTDDSPNFAWCKPEITHIRWDKRPVVRRIVRWADKVAHGGTDLRHVFTPAEFVRGGTIGPAKEV